MIKYILDNELYHKDYVVEYTNAAFLVGDGYTFKDGLFSGFDPATKRYDQKKWAFAKDENGIPKRDATLKDPRTVFQLLKQHYSRYTIDKVSSITGVSKDNVQKIYAIFAATGKPDKAGTMTGIAGLGSFSSSPSTVTNATTRNRAARQDNSTTTAPTDDDTATFSPKALAQASTGSSQSRLKVGSGMEHPVATGPAASRQACPTAALPQQPVLFPSWPFLKDCERAID